jgi:peroxiredoxin
MNFEVFGVSAQQLQQLEEFSSDAHLVLCLLGSMFYCAARQLDHVRVMHEME